MSYERRYQKPGDPTKTVVVGIGPDGQGYYREEDSGQSVTATTTGTPTASNPAAAKIAGLAQTAAIARGVQSAAPSSASAAVAAAPTASSSVPSLAGLSSASGSVTPVGTAVNGGTLMSDGSVVGGQALAEGEFISGVPYAVPAGAGILAGGIGMYDLFSKHAERGGTGAGMLQGGLSGAAAGAGIGTLIAPGPGTLIGAGIGAAAGGIAGAFGTKSRTRGEEHQRDALIKAGINVPINENAPHGKQWELNPEFASTRDESKLTGADIKDASDFYALIPNYSAYSDAQKIKTAQKALNLGLIREAKGKINVGLKDSPEYQSWVAQMSSAVDSASANQANAQANAEAAAARKADRDQQRKEQALSMLSLLPQTTQGPRYDYGEIAKNPYARY